ncbi:hypothetical protein [Bradyrhizobium sp. AZCC 2289]|uniref:hypothetical protein n=1 Tax=Bradyrhizobium sp. AZCC 2289 TaxID=3117026 RepID=UPI002FF30243
MEKVENLYRTARAQNDSTNTPKQIRSRLRDSRHRRAAANRVGWPIRNRESLVAKALSRKSCRGSLGPVRPAREYDRNAIIVAEGTSGWIFSYRARPGSGAACGAWASAARPVRPAGLRHISEQSVQVRSIDQAGGETASHCQK